MLFLSCLAFKSNLDVTSGGYSLVQTKVRVS